MSSQSSQQFIPEVDRRHQAADVNDVSSFDFTSTPPTALFFAAAVDDDLGGGYGGISGGNDDDGRPFLLDPDDATSSSVTTAAPWNWTADDGAGSPSWAVSAAVSPDWPQFYRPLYKAIGCFFIVVIFVVGLVGNLMVVLVVWRTRSMRTPTNCYLVSLAVADILLLVSAPLPTIVEFFLIVDQSVMAELFGTVGCTTMVSVS